MATSHLTQEQADEYAIGSLEPAFERAIRMHLGECGLCRELVRDSESLAGMLGAAAPRRSAPTHLKKQVYRTAGISRPSPFRTMFSISRAAAGLAAVVVAIAAFTGMVSIKGQMDDLRQANAGLQTQISDALSQRVELAAVTQQLQDQERAAAELQEASKTDRELLLALLSPNSDILAVTAPGETSDSIGRLVWDGDQKRLWFMATQLPQRPGETYQLWAQSGGRYFSLGTFEPDAAGFARYDRVIPEGLATYDAVVVTIERGNGSPVREGPTVFFVSRLRLSN
ncbi:MAG TPA: anti-sigma factor [Tepidiformaceae bacterium]|nr:anti-sigma factor [Tepidiformaceae bacterium]